MSSIKKKQFAFWLLASALLLFLTYLGLVIGDVVLSWTVQGGFANTNAQRIEDRRAAEEDAAQKQAAIAKGYKPLLFPDAVESYASLKALAKQSGVSPLAPQPHTRLYYCNEGYGLVTYTSDRFGFRNPDSNWDQKTKLVLIGDSFAHGACVADSDTLASRLSQHTSVLNLGTAGNNPLHYAALAKVFVPIIQPQRVVVVFYANDNDAGDQHSVFYDQYFLHEPHYVDVDAPTPRPHPELKRFYAAAGPLIQQALQGSESQPSAVAPPPGRFDKLLPHLKLVAIRNLLHRAAEVSDRAAPTIPFSSKLSIDTLMAVCKAPHCKPIVAWIPNSSFWRPDARAPQYFKTLKDYSEEHGVAFYDAAPALNALGEEKAYAVKGPHLSPQGYNAVAEGLRKLL